MNHALIRLLHLASPTLPVGAYTYSQGLEWAVETGVVKDEATALAWITDCLQFGIARFEAVYLARMLEAWSTKDMTRLQELDADFIASRESAELRAETLQMGHSLVRLLMDLELSNPRPQAGEGGAQSRERDMEAHAGTALNDPLPNPSPACGGGAYSYYLRDFSEPSFPLAWSCAAAAWGIPVVDAVAGYLWAWAENQVMAAVKAVPLGQTAGQRLLRALGEQLPTLAEAAVQTSIDDTHNYLPAFAIACSRHETQYTRLFRS